MLLLFVYAMRMIMDDDESKRERERESALFIREERVKLCEQRKLCLKY